ncbi:MAG: 2-oxoglutarate dehydrogenase complex dihydrolipoyllysine-residue succinyltransferase [Alphaproteobacteria bacterium]
MAVEIRVPTLGESVTEATVGQWFKAVGDAVKADEPICELETDKVTLEVPAPSSGVLVEILAGEDDTVEPDALLGMIDETASAAAGSSSSAKPAADPAPAAAPTAAAASDGPSKPADAPHAPSVQRVAAEGGIDANQISGTGPGGRVTKGDALNALAGKAAAPAAAETAPREAGPREERVKMTRLRQTIARRLKEAQNSAAMLTTFNEVDMGNVMALRNDYKAEFEKKHGVRLGFMSFFVKACVQALKEIPAVNAEIDGNELVYKNYYDIGMAVGTPQGLVVPVVRDTDEKSFAGIEKEIGALGKKARDGKLSMADLQGATFTISNGGVYGSLMSTPILNAPQSGILGLHKIQERPMVVEGEIKIRPMMYLALSYDHRIIDGREAVTFLVRVKENIESPERLLIDL